MTPTKPKKPRIAVIGTRGIPANFGGSETVVEQMGELHALEGFELVVYCRRHNSVTSARRYKGMHRVVLPSVNTLSLDTPIHSLLSTLHVLLHNTADVVHYHGVGNAMFLPLLRLGAKKGLVTVDGFDWKRPKWNALARRVLKQSFKWCARWADAIVSDNVPVQEYFRREFGRETDYVAYGTDTTVVPGAEALAHFTLTPRRFFLYVGGLIPDKGVHVLVQAFEQLETTMQLVIIGDTPYFSRYAERLRQTRDPRIRFLGYVYGTPYRQVLQQAYAYVHPLLADGTSPSLLQAMAAGNCVIASDLPETLRVVAGSALTFRHGDVNDLLRQMRYTLDHPELVSELRLRARRRIEERYTWPAIAAQHATLYQRIVQP